MYSAVEVMSDKTLLFLYFESQFCSKAPSRAHLPRAEGMGGVWVVSCERGAMIKRRYRSVDDV